MFREYSPCNRTSTVIPRYRVQRINSVTRHDTVCGPDRATRNVHRADRRGRGGSQEKKVLTRVQRVPVPPRKSSVWLTFRSVDLQQNSNHPLITSERGTTIVFRRRMGGDTTAPRIISRVSSPGGAVVTRKRKRKETCAPVSAERVKYSPDESPTTILRRTVRSAPFYFLVNETTSTRYLCLIALIVRFLIDSICAHFEQRMAATC